VSTHFIPEDLLRHLWSKHYLSAESLTTAAGAPIVIHECGVLNRESGPDFHNAVVEIGGTTYRGDVEFHRSIQDWQAHRHEKNPRYNRVILHVVLNKPEEPVPTISESGRPIPVLILSGALTMPLEKIGDSLAREEFLSQAGAIPCFRTNYESQPSTIYSWLSMLAAERLKAKTDRFHERLCEIHRERELFVEEPAERYGEEEDLSPSEHNPGPEEIPVPETPLDAASLRTDTSAWEQLLFEAVMDCLGYSKNRIPFTALAREVSILRLKQISRLIELQVFDIQAMLFTFSGLLPEVNDVADQQSKVVAHQLRSAWASLHGQLHRLGVGAFVALPPHHKAEWTFAPTRPSNFPTVRLAAAGVLAGKILSERFFDSLIAIVRGKFVAPETKCAQLRQAFDAGADTFWSFHYSFTEASAHPHALLGASRIDDIIVNAVIPIAYLYGQLFRRPDVCEHALNIAREMPVLEENAILRKMERQLFHGKILVVTAFQQQGALQLYGEYCTRRRCPACEIGKEITKAAHP
jgi:hypothetical protein